MTFLEYLIEQSLLDDYEELMEFLGEDITERQMSTSDGTQPWGSKDFDANSLKNEINDFLEKEVRPFIDKSKNEYIRGLKKLQNFGKNTKVIHGEKSTDSILNKIGRGYEIQGMHDLLRGALLTSDAQTQELIQDKVRSVFKIWDSSHKEFGKDKDYGYFGSYHFKVELSNGVIQEIQIMPRSLWNTKEEQHLIYTNTRLKLKQDPSYRNSKEFRELQRRSKDLFLRGSGKKIKI